MKEYKVRIEFAISILDVEQEIKDVERQKKQEDSDQRTQLLVDYQRWRLNKIEELNKKR